jgi:hypothetical protein
VVTGFEVIIRDDNYWMGVALREARRPPTVATPRSGLENTGIKREFIFCDLYGLLPKAQITNQAA